MTFEPPSPTPKSSPELPGAIALLAWVGGGIVAVLVPLVFLAIGYLSEAARLETALQVGAQGLLEQAHRRPGTQGMEPRTPQDLVESLAWLGGKTTIRITGTNHRLLAEKDWELSPPLMIRTAILNQGEKEVWQLELSRSLLPLLIYALLIVFPGLLLGWMTFVALKALPMRAFRLALQEIAVRKNTEERLAKSLSLFSAT
ncbi:MAG: hypothetical protein KGN39_02665, partial [Betaproteobacteria bacterium]|nr:hypothetical protein [Betaproteobacteria bacterium]